MGEIRFHLMVPALAMLLGASAPAQPRTATSYHVGPAGTPGGPGTTAQPWSLAFALAGAGGRLLPGDTVWLRGGAYPGRFQTALAGRPDAPIVFRAWPGERATIDGTLRADGAYLTFWGFEIVQTDHARLSTYGLEARTRGGRFVNLVIHDAGTMGVSFWSPAEDAELVGCIIYNNGTSDHLDHGVYVHNERGRKLLEGNVLFNNLGYGIHMYAGRNNAPQVNVRIEGNTVFNNGTLSRRYRAKGNIIVGGEVPMSGMEVVDNLLYYSGRDGDNLRLGYRPVPNGEALVRGNVAFGGRTAFRREAWPAARVEANVFGATAPPRSAVHVRPNRYEQGRAFITVYNGSRAGSVRVDLSGVLDTGARYAIHNVQDVFGPPVVEGVFAGAPVELPMRGVLPPPPVGRALASPPRTAPAFDVFLVTRQENPR